MKHETKLTKNEKAIESALIAGEYIDVSQFDFDEITTAIKNRQKNAVLNIRVNQNDLQKIKEKAQKIGIKYQSFISELLHQVAQA